MNSSRQKSWRCTVCGYIHTGSHPPDCCPVCGVGPSEFEESAPEIQVSRTQKSDEWRCTVCNYAHMGKKPPQTCPVCAASSTMFSPVSPDTPPAVSGKKEKVVIIGGGVAGVTAAESVRDLSPDAEIQIISNEHGLPYYRLNLTRFLAGEESEKNLIIYPEEWYRKRKISIISDHAKSVNPDTKRVTLSGKKDITYDKLIITMGAHPFRPPFAGGEMDGIMTLRTMDDAKRILELSETACECVSVGGGVLGIETAGALAKRGVKITLLEAHDWLMPRQLNKSAGILLKENLEKIGVRVKTNAEISRFLGSKKISGAELTDGTKIPAELAVITTGIRSNIYIAKRAGIAVDRGVQVDTCLKTSDQNIYAAGDVAEHGGTVYGLWGAAQFQGRIAARNAMGVDTRFGGIPRSNTLKVLDLDLMSIGQITPQDGSYKVIDGFEGDSGYYYFLFHDNRLAGAILFGNTGLSRTVKRVIEEKQDCSHLLSSGAALKDITGFLA